jgi:hypothetical protein
MTSTDQTAVVRIPADLAAMLRALAATTPGATAGDRLDRLARRQITKAFNRLPPSVRQAFLNPRKEKR